MDGPPDIPLDPARNTAGIAVTRLACGAGVNVRIRKGVRHSSGLGSSAASAAAAVVAANALFDRRLSWNQMVHHAAEAEVASAGVAHRDNVAASLLGGFTVATNGTVLGLTPPTHLAFAVWIPRIRLCTATSRRALPKRVPLAAMSDSIAAGAAFICYLMRGYIEAAARTAEQSIVDRAREKLIPEFARKRREALDAGASGVVIAGAGPAIAAFVDDRCADPARVARAIGGFVTKPTGGARVELS